MVPEGEEFITAGEAWQEAVGAWNTQEAERDRLEVGMLYTLKPAPSDMLPPAWLHLLKPSQTVPLSGTKCSFKYLDPMGDILI